MSVEGSGNDRMTRLIHEFLALPEDVSDERRLGLARQIIESVPMPDLSSIVDREQRLNTDRWQKALEETRLRIDKAVAVRNAQETVASRKETTSWLNTLMG